MRINNNDFRLMAMSVFASCALALTTGCGEEDGTGTGGDDGMATTMPGSTGWWGSDTGNNSMPVSITDPVADEGGSSGPAGSGNDSSGPAGGDTEADEDSGGPKVEPDEVFFYGEATVQPGTSLSGFEEFIAFVDGEDACVIVWSIDSVASNDTCAECEYAFDVTRGEPDTEVDVDCQSYDTAWLSTMTGWGYGDGLMYGNLEGGWDVIGEAEFLPDKMNILEWYIPLNQKK